MLGHFDAGFTLRTCTQCHTPDAGKRRGKDGRFHGAGDVNKQPKNKERQRGYQAYPLRRSLDISACGSNRVSQVSAKNLPPKNIYFLSEKSAGLNPKTQTLPQNRKSENDCKKHLIFKEYQVFWWGRVDSNHRRHCQQIYSLSPLATREHPHMNFASTAEKWSWWTDSNPRPADYKSAALPAELHQQEIQQVIS